MTKDAAYKKVEELITRFSEQFVSYKKSEYNETQTRRDFIDPFFKALGWDVDNKQGNAEAYREVIHEDRIKVGKATKAPDYSFRLPGGKRLFFVEAKKPSVFIKDEVLPAYQVRRYGWSAKLAISVITDFEELAIYDCSKKPLLTDKAAVARIKYLNYNDYLTEFDFLWETFSKEKVLKGSFDKFIQGTANKKGTTTVDKEFLLTLDNCRTSLAENIAKLNPALDEDEINFAVQQTIDRIIFLRIAEDRSIEPYGKLQESLKFGNYYTNLFGIFKIADDKYNSGLFNFKKDSISQNLQIDNKVLKLIINQFYYPECPYEFSVLSVEILGSAYEQFLGKTITINKNHKAVIELKPEVRKAGGVYYTPEYIVNYIVENTVGKVTINKTPKQVAELKIVDPACGSGSFLIGAYHYLLNWHTTYYQQNLPQAKKDKAFTPTGSLATSIKKQILLNNIFGVDIDVNAVEVTKLSLLLKCMEGETQSSIANQTSLFNERVLPTLDDNIKSGNSLIDTDYYDTELDFGDEKKIKPFSWHKQFKNIFKNGGFDVVIGNPPYDVLEKDRLGLTTPHLALKRYILFNHTYKPSLGGKLNLFRFFVVKAIQLTKNEGMFGLIVPSSLLGDKSCNSTREFLLSSTKKLEFDCFPQKDNVSKRVFEDAKLSTAVFCGEKTKQVDEKFQKFVIRTYPANSFADVHKECTIKLTDLKAIDPNNLPIPLIDNINWELLRKIHISSGIKNLGEISDFVVRRGEINQTVYRNFIKDYATGNISLIKGVQIGQFKFNKKLSQGKVEWFDEKEFLLKNNFKEIANFERIATQRITGVDEKLRLVASLIQPKAFFADSTNSIHLIKNSKYDLKYLLGLFNSKLFQWRFKLTSTNNNVGTNELQALPIKEINFNNNDDKQKHNTMVKTVITLLELKEELQITSLLSKKEHLKNKIDYCEEKMNELVYQLYNLTEDERKIVEG